MARPNNESVLKRRSIVKRLLDEDILMSPADIKRKVVQEGINTTLQTIKNDIEILSSEEAEDLVDSGVAGLEKVLFELDKELHYNMRERDKCKSEAAKSQFSRLCKDILQKKADVANSIAQIKLERREKKQITYVIRIGEFPVVEVDKDE